LQTSVVGAGGAEVLIFLFPIERSMSVTEWKNIKVWLWLFSPKEKLFWTSKKGKSWCFRVRESR